MGQIKEQKTKKKRYRLYGALVLLLGLAIIVLSFLILFHTQAIEVEGNEYSSKEEIVQLIKKDKYSFNTVYVWAKYMAGRGEKIPCLEKMEVRIRRPWILQVKVKEKPIYGYREGKEGYDYFDGDGYLIHQDAKQIEQVPVFEGVAWKEMKLYEKVKTDKDQLFEKMLQVSGEMKELGLYPQKIKGEDNRISLLLGTVWVQLGSSATAEQIAQIPPILEKLGDQSGTLHLENYEKNSKIITFRIGELPEEVKNTE